jgi:hypothetical protein
MDFTDILELRYKGMTKGNSTYQDTSKQLYFRFSHRYAPDTVERDLRLQYDVEDTFHCLDDAWAPLREECLLTKF